MAKYTPPPLTLKDHAVLLTLIVVSWLALIGLASLANQVMTPAPSLDTCAEYCHISPGFCQQ
jgi:hypothetical protein